MVRLAPVDGRSVRLAEALWRVPLPRTWPDRPCPGRLGRLLDGIWRHYSLEIPPDLPGGAQLPEYLRHEFHGMPNGYYSHLQAQAYDRGFEVVMAGLMARARASLAREVVMSGARTVLDVGCGTARQGVALRDAGIEEVWGLDPCPYLLQVADRRTEGIHLVQGLAEQNDLPEEHFDAATACFVFHELPAPVAAGALVRLGRTLKSGGLLAIVEPSPVQLGSLPELVRRFGLLGAWFWALARLVYEPWLDDWHSTLPGPWLAANGYTLIEDRVDMPFRTIVARRAT